MNRTSKTFRGIEYRPTSMRENRIAGLRWYRVAHHSPSGMEYGEECCHKLRTLADCRRDAEDIAQAEREAKNG